MIYLIGNTTIDSNKYRDKFASRYKLRFMKEIVELSGCTLKEAKELIDKVIHEENIEINPTLKEIQDYCLAVLQDDEFVGRRSELMKDFLIDDEIIVQQVSIKYANGMTVDYQQQDINFSMLNKLFSHLYNEASQNRLFTLDIDRGNQDLHVEFGLDCCNIQMDTGDTGYFFVTPSEPEEYVDLFANCYSRRILCINFEHLFITLRTFILLGLPDNNFQWEAFDM